MALSTLGAFAFVPDSVAVRSQQMHVQGIAVDTLRSRMYFSFTDRFIATDYEGNLLGSIDRIEGHLGAMTLGPDGRVYASLECKDDEIGRGIARRHGTEVTSESSFYIAVIDPETMKLETHRVKEACEDYSAPGHRFGCSGIDGVTFAPKPGSKSGRKYLYIAYGVYSDTTRTDNDNQVLLRYDPSSWRCRDRYFIFTGNTAYGVQNMAWDASTGNLFLAVYNGRKSRFPNYSLFEVDMSSLPVRSDVAGTGIRGKNLKVLSGWHFKWGSTGLCPLGDGRWYFSENSRNAATGLQDCVARLYLSDPAGQIPFVPKR